MIDLPLINPNYRTAEEISKVLADPSSICAGPVYEMFREVAICDEDRRWLSSHTIRYDITRIPYKAFGSECVKTKGHYHPPSPDGCQFPEIYEVLEGKALYLLQKDDISDVILIEAGKGDLILIPPGYGHVTINPGPETLLMANLVNSTFSSVYIPYEEKQGAAYYVFSDDIIKPNPKYKELPELRRFQAIKNPEPFPQKRLYECIGDEKSLDFLNHPKKYEEQFKKLVIMQ